jgi:flagellum-specific peptidoglycan hydrolase FlgJ
MIKKLLFLTVFALLFSCSSSKPVIVTAKKPTTQPTPKVVKIDKKPEVKTTPTTTETTQQNSQTEVLEATSKVKVTTEIVLAYIDDFKEVAKKNMQNHGVPASIALAQAILESGAGTGDLCKKANNHFGVKCHKEWNGPSVRHDDDEAQECFRKYNNAYDSYQDYADFLRTRKWYDPLFKLEKNDYVGWAKGLKKSGYATDPKYPSKLIGIIERYQLQKYDAEVLGIEYIEKKPEIVEVKKEKINNKPEILNSESHQVVKGDTLYSISKRYNISIDDIKKKNNISDNSISIGQILQIK